MTWTYDLALTASKDQVRFLIGDTNESSQLLADEEIAFAITSEGNIYSAGALLAETLSGRFSSQVDKSVGDLKLRFGERAERYLLLAKSLRNRVLLNVRFHTTGAESISSKAIDPADTDLVQPFFRRGMHDNIRESDA